MGSCALTDERRESIYDFIYDHNLLGIFYNTFYKYIDTSVPGDDSNYEMTETR